MTKAFMEILNEDRNIYCLHYLRINRRRDRRDQVQGNGGVLCWSASWSARLGLDYC